MEKIYVWGINSFVIALLFGTLIFLAPKQAFSQAGCCQNTSSGLCIPGSQNEQQCTNLPNRIWFPDDPPCVGGQVCQSFTGCCVIGENNCENDVEESACQGIDWVSNTNCSEVPECNIPPEDTGCCVLGENSCIPDQTEELCDGESAEWLVDQSCEDVPECNVPPEDTGCCVLGENSCISDQTEEQCDGESAEWFVDQSCENVSDCNVLSEGQGCCILGPGECEDDFTEEECDTVNGDFNEGDSCLEFDICQMPPPPPPPPPPVSAVPTISQWGMIAMAGLLGIFSLILIRKRHPQI